MQSVFFPLLFSSPHSDPQNGGFPLPSAKPITQTQTSTSQPPNGALFSVFPSHPPPRKGAFLPMAAGVGQGQEQMGGF